MNDEFSDTAKLRSGVPPRLNFGPLIFLMYVNDMFQAVDCDIILYADVSCLVFTGENIKCIDETFNHSLNSLCDWFVENKISIHFWEDTTKFISLLIRKKPKSQEVIDITRGDIKNKQLNSVEYLGCILDIILLGQSMFNKVIEKISAQLQFVYRRQSFLITRYGNYSTMYLYNQIFLRLECMTRTFGNKVQEENINHTK